MKIISIIIAVLYMVAIVFLTLFLILETEIYSYIGYGSLLVASISQLVIIIVERNKKKNNNKE